jgi:hypothetical protein
VVLRERSDRGPRQLQLPSYAASVRRYEPVRLEFMIFGKIHEQYALLKPARHHTPSAQTLCVLTQRCFGAVVDLSLDALVDR